MKAYLQPQHDSRKSFYNKAVVEMTGTGYMKLYSYGALVAEIDAGAVKLRPKWDYSPTTLRHVKEFLKQNGHQADTKEQIQETYA